MQDRCTPGALKPLKDVRSENMNATPLMHVYTDVNRFRPCNFYSSRPGSWTAAVLSDRNSKLTCVLCAYYTRCALYASQAGDGRGGTHLPRPVPSPATADRRRALRSPLCSAPNRPFRLEESRIARANRDGRTLRREHLGDAGCRSRSSAISCNCTEGSVFGSARAGTKVVLTTDQDMRHAAIHSHRQGWKGKATAGTLSSARSKEHPKKVVGSCVAELRSGTDYFVAERHPTHLIKFPGRQRSGGPWAASSALRSGHTSTRTAHFHPTKGRPVRGFAEITAQDA